jgi:lipoate-protein ligase B
MSRLNKKAYCLDLGIFEYEPVWDFQKRIVEAKISQSLPDILILVEHLPVYTMGKGADSGHLLIEADVLKEENIPLFNVERGGDITWHGPGQLVCYPVFSLNRKNGDLHRFVYLLEEAIILTLKEFKLDGRREENARGVWVDDKKIASIGLAVRGRTVYHGVALNISPDMSFFDWIIPCGLSDVRMCSMSNLLGKPVSVAMVKEVYMGMMAGLFGLLLSPITLKEACKIYMLTFLD